MMRRTIATTAVVWLTGASLLAAQPPADAQHPNAGDEAQRPHMAHRFDDAERYASAFDDPARDAWQMPERVIETLDVRAGQAIADIGAGTGYFTVRLARSTAARTVYAVDIEPAMVDHVRTRAADEGLEHVVTVLADSDATNLPEPVDLVLIVNTFHHIPDRVAYFTALQDLMTPGARLAIVDYKKGAPGEGPPEAFRFTPDEIGDELGRAGFELLARHDFLPRQSFLIFGVR
jgi:ubiquinone/menaquinone biosynthesis C-methylase UbiE